MDCEAARAGGYQPAAADRASGVWTDQTDDAVWRNGGGASWLGRRMGKKTARSL